MRPPDTRESTPDTGESRASTPGSSDPDSRDGLAPPHPNNDTALDNCVSKLEETQIKESPNENTSTEDSEKAEPSLPSNGQAHHAVLQVEPLIISSTYSYRLPLVQTVSGSVLMDSEPLNKASELHPDAQVARGMDALEQLACLNAQIGTMDPAKQDPSKTSTDSETSPSAPKKDLPVPMEGTENLQVEQPVLPDGDAGNNPDLLPEGGLMDAVREVTTSKDSVSAESKVAKATPPKKGQKGSVSKTDPSKDSASAESQAGK